MRFHLRRLAVLAVGVLTTAGLEAFTVDDLQLPPGYRISVYAEGIENPRQLALAPSGIVYAGSLHAGFVYAVIDEDGDFRAEKLVEVADGLTMPSGIAYRDGALYVAEVSRVTRYLDEGDGQFRQAKTDVVIDDLPAETHHGWKFIAFDAAGRLHVPVGAPCNVCLRDEPFGTILRYSKDFSSREVVARGVRNSVGFDWRPGGGELWFSDNGRDWLGDNLPPGELNRVMRAGAHFGFPHRHGDDVIDPQYGEPLPGLEMVSPALKLGAHVAPLGIEFYQGSMFPADAGATLFVAEHGSWNRSKKSGYRVMKAVVSDSGRVLSYEPFITGWLKGQAHSGRPVDFEVLADGSLLVSDDHANRIYRVTYEQ